MPCISLLTLLQLSIYSRIFMFLPCAAHPVRVICFSLIPFAVDLWCSITTRIGNLPAITLHPRAHLSSCYPQLLPVAKLEYTALPGSDAATTTEPPSHPLLPLLSSIIQSRYRRPCRVCSPPHNPRTLVRLDMSIRMFPGLLPQDRSRIPNLIHTKPIPPMG